MSPFDKVHLDILFYLAQELDLESTYSWILTARRFHFFLLSRLYSQAIVASNQRYGWPFYLVRACVLNNILSFNSMLKMTPLACINEANIDARRIPKARHTKFKKWSFSSALENWKDRPEKLVCTSLLHIVCQLRDLELVEAVLAKGVSTSVFDVHGYSPLHTAAKTE
jgi:hypothetical protein